MPPRDQPERRQRCLTDADIEALATALESKFKDNFYGDIGRGVWAVVWRVIVGGLIAIAAYGSFKGLK